MKAFLASSAFSLTSLRVTKRIVPYHLQSDAHYEAGQHALFCAARNARLETVNVLIGAGAAVDAALVAPGSRIHGITPLMTAARQKRPNAVEVVVALRKAGADPHKKNGEGKTALDRAKEHRTKKCVAALKAWLVM
jgi:ankyrin repeat protein